MEFSIKLVISTSNWNSKIKYEFTEIEVEKIQNFEIFFVKKEKVLPISMFSPSSLILRLVYKMVDYKICFIQRVEGIT